MKLKIICFLLLLLFNNKSFSQYFDINSNETQQFVISNKIDGNQISFFSSTPLEDINGTVEDIAGSVSFTNSSFDKSLKASITVKVNTLNTGIPLRNKHLQSQNWLDASSFPTITFNLKSISDIQKVGANKIKAKVLGDFTLHGKTKVINADAELVFVKANEQTAKRAQGDLLGVNSKFSISLSEFGVDNSLIGKKVADKIEISVQLIGSNK